MKKKDLQSEIPLKNPLVIHIETTNICNFKCTFCPESNETYEQKSGGYKSMSYDTFKSIADDIQKAFGEVSVLRLWIMGEPLLNKSIFKMIRYAKEKSIAKKIEMTTNGSLLNKYNRENLVSSGLDLCKISIYGKDKEEMKRISQTNVTPDHVLNCIKELSILIKSSESSMKTMAKTIASHDDKIAVRYMQKIEEYVNYIEINGIHSWTSKKDTFSSQEEVQNISIEKKVCAFPFYTMAIHADGNVSPCCVDWKKDEVLGNINETNIGNIWNGTNSIELRNNQLKRTLENNKGCLNCNYFIENCPENIDSLMINS